METTNPCSMGMSSQMRDCRETLPVRLCLCKELSSPIPYSLTFFLVAVAEDLVVDLVLELFDLVVFRVDF